MDAAEIAVDKKKRVTHSCDVCRRKRTKCDGQEPVCSPCTIKGWECSWTAPKKRGPAPGKQVQLRMQKMEGHLYDLYTYIPGLRDVSEMLLGISDYNPSLVNKELVPTLPRQYEESLALEEKVEAFRTQPAGKLFLEEGEEFKSIFKQEEPTPPAAYGTRKRLRQGSAEPSAIQGRAIPPAVPIVRERSDVSSTSPAPSGLSPTNILASSSISSETLQPFSRSSMIVPHDGDEDHSPESIIAPRQLGPASLAIAKSFYWHRGTSNIAKSYGPTSGFGNIDISLPSSVVHSAPFDIANLPPVAYRARLLDVYVNVVHPLVPMCSRQTLIQWAYDLKPVFDEYGGPELLFAVLACAGPYVIPGPEVTGQIHGDSMADQARQALQQALLEPSVSCVQAQILLALYEWGRGGFTKAWLYLASALALAVDLGLHIGSEGEPGTLEKRRLTWHSIVVIDISLALQLGRVPLTPAGHTVPFPNPSGSDEWEMQRSEPVQTLQAYYAPSANGQSASDPANTLFMAGPGGFGSSCPARTLSTFVLASNVAQLSHKALTIMNSPHSGSDDTILLLQAKIALDSLAGEFSEFYASNTGNLQHTAQSRVDLFLRWCVMRTSIEQILTPQTVLTSCTDVTRILQHKLQSFSWFRTPVPTSMVCLFYASLSLPDAGQRSACKVARQQMRKIFPGLLDRLESMSYLPIDLSEDTISNRFSLASEAQLGSAMNQSQQATNDGPMDGHSIGSLLNAAASIFDAQPFRTSEGVIATEHISECAGLPESGARIDNAQQYSLPHQAMQSLADLFEKTDEVATPGGIEATRIFDSASWAQTDVLSSLGFIAIPNLSQAPSPNEVSGLTGLLDRWNHGDGQF